MEAVKGGEDLGSSHSDEEGDEDQESLHSDEEEDGDHSGEDGEAVAPEEDAAEERVGPDPDASTEDHGLNATTRGPNPDHGCQKLTAITRLSSVDEPLEEITRSSTGSGASPVVRSVSVETGLRNLEVSEGGVLEAGERTPVLSFAKPAHRAWVLVWCICVLMHYTLRPTPSPSILRRLFNTRPRSRSR